MKKVIILILCYNDDFTIEKIISVFKIELYDIYFLIGCEYYMSCKYSSLINKTYLTKYSWYVL